MSAAGKMWQTDRTRLIGLAGAGVAVAAMLLNIGFLFRPGVSDVLSGLAHHGFILAWLLVLTAGSRTVSLGTLGMFWLFGVWGVYGLAYLVEQPMASQSGAEMSDTFVPVWWAPFSEEILKLLPVAVFMLLAGRDGLRHPAPSDGLLLGFMIGAGVSFQEDAHIGSIQLSGAGWGAGTPWTAIFPTISPIGDVFALNHALWAALSGLSVGVAMTLRHWRFAWPVVLIGPVLGLTNHIMLNYFVGNLLGLLGRADVPWFYDTIRDLTSGGRLPMQVLIAGAVAVAVLEWVIQRSVTRRDNMFPPLPIARVFSLIGGSTSRAGVSQLLAADRYVRLRRALYFGGWRTSLAGGTPAVTRADIAELNSLRARLGIRRAPASAPPVVPAAAQPAAPVE